ncbi:hypothetical protein [Oricola indica]|uniref:hypothetical protein n=1 Tax=Oricola indica TaxID=2872591 RepID=UPI003CCC01DE
MADDLQTFREVTQSLRGVRVELRLYVAGFAIALGVLGWAMNKGFDKLDALEASNARIEGMMSTLVTDAKQIKENTALASADPLKPAADSFDGYVGVQTERLQADAVPALMEGKIKDGWVFLPAE